MPERDFHMPRYAPDRYCSCSEWVVEAEVHRLGWCAVRMRPIPNEQAFAMQLHLNARSITAFSLQNPAVRHSLSDFITIVFSTRHSRARNFLNYPTYSSSGKLILFNGKQISNVQPFVIPTNLAFGVSLLHLYPA